MATMGMEAMVTLGAVFKSTSLPEPYVWALVGAVAVATVVLLRMRLSGDVLKKQGLS